MNLLHQVQELFEKGIPDDFKQLLQIVNLNNKVVLICLAKGAFKKCPDLNKDKFRLHILNNLFSLFSILEVKTSMRLQNNGIRAVHFYIGTDHPEFVIKHLKNNHLSKEKKTIVKQAKQLYNEDPIFANLLLDEMKNPTSSPKGEPMFPARRRSF